LVNDLKQESTSGLLVGAHHVTCPRLPYRKQNADSAAAQKRDVSERF
jgi:hypothetical protein